jgi:hypothetical protein
MERGGEFLMRKLITLAAIPALSGLLLAQTQTTSPSTQSEKSQTEAQRGASSETRPSDVKIQRWSGTLADANCAAGGSATTTRTESTTSSQSTTAERSATGEEKTRGGEHRKHQETMPAMNNCPVSGSTTAYALRLSDGKVLKFDEIGNTRVSEALKAKKNWSDKLSNNKPIHAKVSGMLNGDTITVTSVD